MAFFKGKEEKPTVFALVLSVPQPDGPSLTRIGALEAVRWDGPHMVDLIHKH